MQLYEASGDRTVVIPCRTELGEVSKHAIAVNDFYWGEPDFPYPMGMEQNSELHLDYTLNNTETADRLVYRWTSVLKSISRNIMHVIPFSIYPRNVELVALAAIPKPRYWISTAAHMMLITFTSSMVAFSPQIPESTQR